MSCSQGALLAHDSFHRLDATTQKKVKAVVTFGDPITRFQNLKQDLPVPLVPHSIGCIDTGDAFDTLCISMAELEKKFPLTKGSFTEAIGCI